MITRHPRGESVLWRGDGGRLLAGVGTDAEGHWTWWSRTGTGRNRVASRELAEAAAARAAEVEEAALMGGGL